MAIRAFSSLYGGLNLPSHFDRSLFDDEFTRAVFTPNHTTSYLSSIFPFLCVCGKPFAECENKGGPLALPACLTIHKVPCGTVYGVAMVLREWCPAAILAWSVQYLESGNDEAKELARLIRKLKHGFPSLKPAKEIPARAAKKNQDVVKWLQTLSPLKVGKTVTTFQLYGELVGDEICMWVNLAYIATACLEYGEDAYGEQDPFAVTVEAISRITQRGVSVKSLSSMIGGDVAACAISAAFDTLCIEGGILPSSLLRLLTVDEALFYRGWTFTGYGWGRTVDWVTAGFEFDCPTHVSSFGYYAALTDLTDCEKDVTDTHDNIANSFPELDWPALIRENLEKCDCCTIHVTFDATLWWQSIGLSHIMYRPREEVLSILRGFNPRLDNYGHAWRKAVREARFSGEALAELGCMQKWEPRPVVQIPDSGGREIVRCSICRQYETPFNKCSCARASNFASPVAREKTTTELQQLFAHIDTSRLASAMIAT